MRMLLLEEKESATNSILENLHATGIRISDNCQTLNDCIRWLKTNLDSSYAGESLVSRNKSRIVVKRGKEYQTLKVKDIVYFFSDQKVIFVVDRDNRKYMAEKTTLGKLEEELDKNSFYRVNRKYIINADFIKGFKPMAKSRIKLEIALPVNEEIIISQENSSEFRRWIEES